MKKHRKNLIFIFAFLLFSSLPLTLLALELDYPEIEISNQIFTLNPATSPSEFIIFFYYFTLALGGIAAFAVILSAGVSYFTSFGNPSAMKEAGKKFLASFLGIIILVSSFVILRTINPDLVVLKSLDKITPPDKKEAIAPPSEGLELNYPAVKIGEKEYTITKATTPAEFIFFIYYFVLVFGGVLASGSLIYAGFKRVISTGRPEAVSESNKRVLSAFLGLIIIISSFIILRTINPDLTFIKSWETIKAPPIGEITEAPPYHLPEKPIPEYIKYIVNISIIGAALLAFGALVYAGFLLVSSAGDPKRISRGKSWAINSLVGLFIVLSASVLLGDINPQFLFLKMPVKIIPEIKTPEIPSEEIMVRQAICKEFAVKEIINDLLGSVQRTGLHTFTEEKGLLKEGLGLGEEVYDLSDKIATSSKKVARLAKECFCAKEAKRIWLSDNEADLEGYITIPNTAAVCHPDCNNNVGPACTKTIPPFCSGDPCPPQLKATYIPNLREDLMGANETIAALDENLKKMKEKREELEKALEEIKLCRSDSNKKLLTCGELKDMLGEKKDDPDYQKEALKISIGKENCEDFNFYCCD